MTQSGKRIIRPLDDLAGYRGLDWSGFLGDSDPSHVSNLGERDRGPQRQEGKPQKSPRPDMRKATTMRTIRQMLQWTCLLLVVWAVGTSYTYEAAVQQLSLAEQSGFFVYRNVMTPAQERAYLAKTTAAKRTASLRESGLAQRFQALAARDQEAMGEKDTMQIHIASNASTIAVYGKRAYAAQVCSVDYTGTQRSSVERQTGTGSVQSISVSTSLRKRACPVRNRCTTMGVTQASSPGAIASLTAAMRS
jgi:hypothetical protein